MSTRVIKKTDSDISIIGHQGEQLNISVVGSGILLEIDTDGGAISVDFNYDNLSTLIDRLEKARSALGIMGRYEEVLEEFSEPIHDAPF